jgi:hypothetical protein
MTATALSPESGRLDVGDSWLLAVEVRDDVTGDLKDATVVAVVTRPDTSTNSPTVVRQSLGTFYALYTLAAAGRHTALVTSSGAVVSVTDFAVEAVVPGALPTATEAQTYLQSTGATSYTLTDIGLALAAETAAQGRVCRVDAVYPADLREALYRRVARNLAARSVRVASFTSFEGGGTSVRVPAVDAEVRRLEAPHRRLTVG